MKLHKYFALYKDKRLRTIFFLGTLSGFPWVLIGSAMTAWLQEANLTRSAIGFFGSIFVVYALNFLWAPLLDMFNIPLLHTLGRRRSWIVVMQAVILVLVLGIAFTNPASSLIWTSVLALGIAIASATQDIAIDAYRIEIISEEEINKVPAAAAMATSGWWTGYSLLGAFAFILSDQAGVEWKHVYLSLSVYLVISLLFVLRIDKPSSQVYADTRSHTSGIVDLLFNTVLKPLLEFFQRNGVALAFSLLLFVFLFKLGEAFLGRMSIVFYKEIGLSNTDIGIYSKILGWFVIVVLSLVSSELTIRYGLVKGLMFGGLAMASTNLMFSWMSIVGPLKTLFAATVIIDTATAAFASVAFVAFISHLTNRAYTATQYALLASLGNLGRTSIAVFSGALVDYLGGDWALFFVITAVMVLPSLILLAYLAKQIKQ